MENKSKLYKKFIRTIAYVLVFFKVVFKKPKYRNAFIGTVGGVVLLIALIIVACNCQKKNKDDSEIINQELINEYVTVKTEDESPESGENGGIRIPDSVFEISEEEWDKLEYDKEKDSTDSLWYGTIDVNLEGLQKLNPDMIGWIYFESANINYPVLYSGDDEKYLRTCFDGKTRVAGSIFLEGDNSKDFTDKHSLIYGHNLKNSTMFSQLLLYKKDSDYYSNHQYFELLYLDSESGSTIKERYRIFACKEVDVDDDVYYIYDKNFTNLSDFANNVIRPGNLLKNTEDIVVTNSDKVITLSTCSGKSRRFVVSAVKVSECSVDN